MGGGYLPDYMSEGDDIVDLDEAGKPFFDSEDEDEVDCIHCKDKAHEHQACTESLATLKDDLGLWRLLWESVWMAQ
ncbi:hypothetical protein ACHQM5_028099 [Ranunculus cassubicifolius]